mgnify:CR=1 FL=1
MKDVNRFLKILISTTPLELDFNYDFDVKQNILNQLKHRKDVKIPAALQRELGKKYPALWGGYIYADDDSIVTILSLIAPGIVGKIHPIGHFQ